MVLMNASPLCPPSSLQVLKQRLEFLLLPGDDALEVYAIKQGNTHLPNPPPARPPTVLVASFLAH